MEDLSDHKVWRTALNLGEQSHGAAEAIGEYIARVLFATSIFAECNRLPFDLPESEQELVGGYHTEYSSMKFALFLFGEYTHMITTSFLMMTVFFGAWHLPFITDPNDFSIFGIALKFAVAAGKTIGFIIFYIYS